MAKLTCDKDIDKQITLDTQDYTNNIEAMNEIANSDYQSAFLGGQNHIALFAKSAEKIDMSNAGPYDQGCNEQHPELRSAITSTAPWISMARRRTSKPRSWSSIRN